MSLAQSDREREIIWYTAVVSSGLSATAARKHYGFDTMQHRIEKVEHVLQEVKDIHLAFENVANIQESATLAQFGITLASDSGESDTSDTEPDDTGEFADPHTEHSLSREEILDILKAAQWNWFQVICTAEEREIPVALVELEYNNISSDLTDPSLSLLHQSHNAFLEKQAREAASFNGEVVSESESENPDDYIDSERAKAVLKKKIKAIRLKCRRDRMKLVAQRRFLHRRISTKISGIVDKYPDIGKEIETYVQARSIGADAWRRTGVLTFDGNNTVKEKVTYSGIKKHLEHVYKRKFAYRTVVQLCVARNLCAVFLSVLDNVSFYRIPKVVTQR